MKKANPSLNTTLAMAVFSAFLATQSFAAGVEKSELKGPKVEIDQAKNDALDAKGRMVEISQKLNIPSAELTGFFKQELASGKGNKRAWSELMVFVTMKPKANATAEDFQHVTLASEALSNYIGIRNSKVVDNLSIRETDLVEVQKGWTIDQKTNFNKVLKRTSELAKTGRFNTLEDAFNQALVDTGYAAKYRSCRI